MQAIGKHLTRNLENMSLNGTLSRRAAFLNFAEQIRMREVMDGACGDKVARGFVQNPGMEAWSSRAGIGALISVGFYAGGRRRFGTVKCEQKVCACRLSTLMRVFETMRAHASTVAENVQRRSRVGSDEVYAALSSGRPSPIFGLEIQLG